jgi:hypothetical protein
MLKASGEFIIDLAAIGRAGPGDRARRIASDDGLILEIV